MGKGHRRRPRDREGESEDPPKTIDLHGLRVAEALRRLARELHACRVQRLSRVVVITGHGEGRDKVAALKPAVIAFLEGGEGQRLGVLGFQLAHKGGALAVELATP